MLNGSVFFPVVCILPSHFADFSCVFLYITLFSYPLFPGQNTLHVLWSARISVAALLTLITPVRYLFTDPIFYLRGITIHPPCLTVCFFHCLS